jgi:hypothetical protein
MQAMNAFISTRIDLWITFNFMTFSTIIIIAILYKSRKKWQQQNNNNNNRNDANSLLNVFLAFNLHIPFFRSLIF